MQDETEFFQHMRESVRQMSLVSRRIEGARFAVVNWFAALACSCRAMQVHFSAFANEAVESNRTHVHHIHQCGGGGEYGAGKLCQAHHRRLLVWTPVNVWLWKHLISKGIIYKTDCRLASN